MEFVNWDIAKHPMNWLTVVLMLVIAGAAVHLLLGDRVKPA